MASGTLKRALPHGDHSGGRRVYSGIPERRARRSRRRRRRRHDRYKSFPHCGAASAGRSRREEGCKGTLQYAENENAQQGGRYVMIGFTFNNVHSRDMGVVFKSDDRTLLPAKRITQYKIPGKSGTYDIARRLRQPADFQHQSLLLERATHTQAFGRQHAPSRNGCPRRSAYFR